MKARIGRLAHYLILATTLVAPGALATVDDGASPAAGSGVASRISSAFLDEAPHRAAYQAFDRYILLTEERVAGIWPRPVHSCVWTH